MLGGLVPSLSNLPFHIAPFIKNSTNEAGMLPPQVVSRITAALEDPPLIAKNLALVEGNTEPLKYALACETLTGPVTYIQVFTGVSHSKDCHSPPLAIAI